jgi:hypothetical protein
LANPLILTAKATATFNALATFNTGLKITEGSLELAEGVTTVGVYATLA